MGARGAPDPDCLLPDWEAALRQGLAKGEAQEGGLQQGWGWGRVQLGVLGLEQGASQLGSCTGLPKLVQQCLYISTNQGMLNSMACKRKVLQLGQAADAFKQTITSVRHSTQLVQKDITSATQVNYQRHAEQHNMHTNTLHNNAITWHNAFDCCTLLGTSKMKLTEKTCE